MTNTPAKWPLERSDVHVFLCRPESVDDAASIDRCYALLDATERTRYAAFHRPQDAHTFLVAHAIVRTSLSLFSAVAPEAWAFQYNAYGKPEIATSSGTTKLRFNLTHTRGLVACAIIDSLDVGVDAEGATSPENMEIVAASFFAPQELWDFRSTPPQRQVDKFLSLWTLKEAYLKASGIGLSQPSQHFAFQLDDNRIKVRFEKEIADHSEDWSFALARPTTEHWLAVAIRTGSLMVPITHLYWLHPFFGIQAN